jgi:hypothetical protein
LKERYKDDSLTHPDFNPNLWLDVGSFNGPNRNKMYGFSNTTVEDLQMNRSVSTIKCSQSISSTQTPKFKVILDQRVQARTIHLTIDYAQLGAETVELRRLVMEMKPHMSGTCSPHYWPHGPGEDPPPPPFPASLF